MKIPEITHLNRLNDVFFKSLLGSEERKALTLNFINSILDRDENNAFIDLIFADKEVVPQRIHGKLSLLDVLAEMNDGTRVHIEVQVLLDEYMANRTLYYWGRIYGRELEAGEPYQHLQPVITIDLLNYNQFPQYDAYSHTYHIANDQNHDILTNHLEMHFIELKKIHISDIKKLKRADRWIAYFSPRCSDPERKVLAMSDTAIKDALTYENQFTNNNALKSQYWDYEKTMRDIASVKLSGETIGREKGRKEGRKEGRKILGILIQKLMQEGRMDEIEKVLADEVYQEKLLHEYRLI